MLTITREHKQKLIEHAQEASPYECCGILAGNDNSATHLYPITNTATSRELYLMDPQQHLNVTRESRKHGRELLAFYHSHPKGPAQLSETDVNMAQKSGWAGEDIYYILVSLAVPDEPVVKAFHILENGTVLEKPLTFKSTSDS
jgi:proteasome lid subunit RPN8/RPN11